MREPSTSTKVKKSCRASGVCAHYCLVYDFKLCHIRLFIDLKWISHSYSHLRRLPLIPRYLLHSSPLWKTDSKMDEPYTSSFGRRTYLPLNNGTARQSLVVPCWQNWPSVISRNVRGMPKMSAMLMYATRNAPAKVEETFISTVHALSSWRAQRSGLKEEKSGLSTSSDVTISWDFSLSNNIIMEPSQTGADSGMCPWRRMWEAWNFFPDLPISTGADFRLMEDSSRNFSDLDVLSATRLQTAISSVKCERSQLQVPRLCNTEALSALASHVPVRVEACSRRLSKSSRYACMK